MTTIDGTETKPGTSRRALFGVGAVLAAGTAAATVAEAAPAQAAPELAAAHRGRQYSSASAAARAVRTHSTVFPHDPVSHLLRRATFGARPQDVADVKRLGIDGWLARQLNPGSITDGAATRAMAQFPLAGASPTTIMKRTKQYSWDAMMATVQGSLVRQAFSQRQLYEIVVDVFANHLHIAIPSEQWTVSPGYDKNVIRRYALGRFEDMLLAAMKHPALLNFLSNDQSTKANVNENLGRELLELHTVGLAAKYSEAEVRASASIMSGRTWNYSTGEYFYNPTMHATGRVKVLGFSDANRDDGKGEAMGDRYLKYLAHHPLTAKHIALKLATRFVSDSPSSDLVDRLAKVYLANGTSIKAVVAAIFHSSDFWASVGQRMRRPIEDAVGAMRVLDVRTASKMTPAIGALYWNLNQSGQTPYGWVPPNGYPDVAAAWLGSGSMIQRWNLHRAVVYGWWKPLGWTPASKLVGWSHGQTALDWARAVAKRLFGFAPPSPALVAAVHGAHLKAGDPAPTDDWTCGKVVALLLDSPYFQLR